MIMTAHYLKHPARWKTERNVKCDQLLLAFQQIIETVTVAISCQIMRLKCIKFDFSDPTVELSLTVLPQTA